MEVRSHHPAAQPRVVGSSPWRIPSAAPAGFRVHAFPGALAWHMGRKLDEKKKGTRDSLLWSDLVMRYVVVCPSCGALGCKAGQMPRMTMSRRVYA